MALTLLYVVLVGIGSLVVSAYGHDGQANAALCDPYVQASPVHHTTWIRPEVPAEMQNTVSSLQGLIGAALQEVEAGKFYKVLRLGPAPGQQGTWAQYGQVVQGLVGISVRTGDLSPDLVESVLDHWQGIRGWGQVLGSAENPNPGDVRQAAAAYGAAQLLGSAAYLPDLLGRALETASSGPVTGGQAITGPWLAFTHSGGETHFTQVVVFPPSWGGPG